MHKLLIALPLACCLSLTISCDKKTPMAATPPSTEAAPAQIKKTVQLRVDGMSCDGCVNAIVKKVDALDGVVSCDVSLEERSATIALSDPDAENTVEEAIRKLGYTVEPASTNPTS